MLAAEYTGSINAVERTIFLRMVPHDHFLLRLMTLVDFHRFRAILQPHYHCELGRPATDPLLLLKLELLAFLYRLSDREVIAQAQVNVAHRLFLDLGSEFDLPHHTSLCYFRQRIGVDVIDDIFYDLLAQARQLGLISDRLRLKDATHVLADIAIPTTIVLCAQMRDRLLEACQPFDPVDAQRRWQQVELQSSNSLNFSDENRLLLRVGQLRELVNWAETLTQTAAFATADPGAQNLLVQRIRLARKVLADRDDPEAGDRLLSLIDADARCGWHHGFYEGYLVDVSMDADSEFITSINVLPANGDEGADAAYLIAHEEEALGNDVAALSLDGAGFRGSVLRELTDPAGLALEVFTPPSERIPLTVFSPEEFPLSEDGSTLTCPAGQTTRQHERNGNDTGRKFRFSKKQCGDCPLRGKCLSDEKTKSRRVIKNDYEKEYQAARAKAETESYRQTRQEHPAIERKLSELVNRQGLRRARYRGQNGVHRQALLSALVVNLKRLVRLHTAVKEKPVADKSAETVRAEGSNPA